MRRLECPISHSHHPPLVAGRVLNRFTNDTDMVDFTLVTKTLQAVASMGWLLTSFVVIASVVPFMLIPLSAIVCLFFTVKLCPLIP